MATAVEPPKNVSTSKVSLLARTYHFVNIIQVCVHAVKQKLWGLSPSIHLNQTIQILNLYYRPLQTNPVPKPRSISNMLNFLDLCKPQSPQPTVCCYCDAAALYILYQEDPVIQPLAVLKWYRMLFFSKCFRDGFLPIKN